MWKQKEVTSGREGPIFSKSSGESSVPFHRENSFQKKNCSPGRIREARSSGASQESPSIFQRLGDAAFDSTQEARSTKGSRSPPSVFEWLGCQALSSSEKKRKTAGISTSKRRRLSGSDDRRVKKAKVDTLDDHSTPPSVFQRLGSNNRGSSGRGSSGAKNSSELNHYAHVAARAPIHSALEVALVSGDNIEEGLMVNSNPSTQLWGYWAGTVRGWEILLQFDIYRKYLVSIFLR